MEKNYNMKGEYLSLDGLYAPKVSLIINKKQNANG